MAQESRLAIIIDSRRAQVDAETLAKTMRTLEDHGVRVTKSNADVSASMDRMASDASAAATSIRRGLVTALGGLSAMAVIDIADDWGQYASRMRMATKSTEEYEHAQSRMLASAQTTYRAINETRESFIQLSPVLRDMGLSLDQSIDAIDTFSGLLVVNGANAQRGAAAMEALAKSFQRGRVDAMAWMTIYTTVDNVVDLLAESSGKTTNEIRKMGVEGKISAEMMAKALVDSNRQIMKSVESMPTTVRDAMQNIGSAFGEYIGRTNESNQVTATLAEGIDLLGSNLEGILNVAIIAAGAGLTAYSAKTTLALVETGKLTVAKIAEAAASRNGAIATEMYAKARLAEAQATVASATGMQRLTLVQTALIPAQRQLEVATKAVAAANRGLGASLLGLIGGPVGGITLAAGLAATAFFTLKSSTKESASAFDDLGKTLEELTEKWRALTIAQNEALKGQYTLQESEAASALERAKEKLDTALAQMGGGFSGSSEQLESFITKINEAGEDTTALVAILRDAETAGILDPAAAQSVIDYAGSQDSAAQAHQKAKSVLEQHLQFMKVFSEEVKNATAAQDGLNLSLGKLPDAAQRQMDTLDRQIALFGKTGQAAQYYYDLEHGSLKDLDAGLKKEFRARVDVLASQEKDAEARARSAKATRAEQKEIERIIQSLESQVSVLGMTEQQAERYRIEITKGTQAQKSQALALLDQKHAHEAAERATRLHTEALRDQRNLAAELDIFRNQQALPITGMGLGERRREQLAAEYAVQEEFARRRRELDEAQRVESTKLDEDLYREQIRYLRDAEEKKIEILREYAAYRLFAERNWVTGMSESLINYANDAANVYESLGGVVSNSFRGMEDALSTLVKNGKLDFSSFADSIISDLIRISVQQSILGPIAGALGGMFGGGGFSSSGPIAGSALQSNGLTGVRVPGFSDGGFTGFGGKYEPAGIVHKGEGVLSQDEIRKLGGESGFNALRRAISGPGHSVGGMAGRPALPQLTGASAQRPQINITVNVSGDGVSASAPSGWESMADDIGRFVDAKFKEHEMQSQRAGGLAWRARQGY